MMSVAIHFHWFRPTYGDSRYLVAGGHGSTMRSDHPADLKYLAQLAWAAEINGFESVRTPTGKWCEDAWPTTAMLVERTETLNFWWRYVRDWSAPGVGLSAVAPVPHWSARTKRWPTESPNTPNWASTISFAPATRIWRRLTSSVRECARSRPSRSGRRFCPASEMSEPPSSAGTATTAATAVISLAATVLLKPTELAQPPVTPETVPTG
jgi:hypothetical protein